MSKLFVTTGNNQQVHKEGDVWSEGGKTWTIKNGLKRTVTKMDEARKDMFTPLACPKCGSSMKHRLDAQMWTIHKTCFNCVIDMEHEIVKAGKWEEYEKSKILANANAYCEDMEVALNEYIKETVSSTHVTEDGIVEKWKDADQTHLKKVVDGEVEELKRRIDEYKNE
jgi:ribosomal protein L37AE/L43A